MGGGGGGSRHDFGVCVFWGRSQCSECVKILMRFLLLFCVCVCVCVCVYVFFTGVCVF